MLDGWETYREQRQPQPDGPPPQQSADLHQRNRRRICGSGTLTAPADRHGTVSTLGMTHPLPGAQCRPSAGRP